MVLTQHDICVNEKISEKKTMCWIKAKQNPNFLRFTLNQILLYCKLYETTKVGFYWGNKLVLNEAQSNKYCIKILSVN